MAELIGYLFTINAIFTWALASLIYKFALGRTEAKESLFFRLVIVSCSTFFVSLIFSNFVFIFRLNTEQLISYLAACIVSGLSVTIGDLLYFFSLRKIDASRTYPLTQLSLVFVYPLAFLFFGEEITPSVFIGGLIILSTIFLLSSKDKPKNEKINNGEYIEDDLNKSKTQNDEKHTSEELIIGVISAIGTAFFWGLAIVSFNQARIVSNDVFITNFLRVLFGTIFFGIIGIFKREYFYGFKKKNRSNLKYYLYIGLGGALSLGFADSFFYKAAEINGLVLTSTFTANTPLVQQLSSVLILKEKFRKRFLIAVVLIIIGNYIILFL